MNLLLFQLRFLEGDLEMATLQLPHPSVMILAPPIHPLATKIRLTPSHPLCIACTTDMHWFCVIAAFLHNGRKHSSRDSIQYWHLSKHFGRMSLIKRNSFWSASLCRDVLCFKFVFSLIFRTGIAEPVQRLRSGFVSWGIVRFLVGREIFAVAVKRLERFEPFFSVYRHFCPGELSCGDA